MSQRNLFLAVVVLLVFTLSACAPANANNALGDKRADMMADKPTEAMMPTPVIATTEPMMASETMMAPETMMASETMMATEAMMNEPEDGMETHETPAPEKPMDGGDASMFEVPEWFGIAMVNVNTGEAFRIKDFKGKVVLVETMAQWCSTCLRQQQQIKVLHELAGMNPDLVSIALDIDPNENTTDLEEYAARQGFDWIYAAAPVEVTRELSRLYGPQFLNPPSAPIFIVDRKGQVHLLPFGVKSAEDLLRELQPFLDEGM